MSRPPITVASPDLILKPKFEKGAKVRLPKGTLVRSLNPKRKEYVLVRAQVVTVNHVLSGMWVSVREALGDFRTRLEAAGFDLSELERWKRENTIDFYCAMVQITEPAVRWPGTGGFWCEVPASLVESI